MRKSIRGRVGAEKGGQRCGNPGIPEAPEDEEWPTRAESGEPGARGQDARAHTTLARKRQAARLRPTVPGGTPR